MVTPWIENYIRLAFRIEKAFQTLYRRRFISYYYGPPAWKAEEDAAPVYPSADLLRMAETLSETLAVQQFEPHRATFLTKQLFAMETICRVFCRGTFGPGGNAVSHALPPGYRETSTAYACLLEVSFQHCAYL